MRDIWFSDKRDLVKWSVLLRLVEQHFADHILQIAYYRPSSFGKVTIDKKEIDIPHEVRYLFRNISNIEKINSRIKIAVFDHIFDNRPAYQKAAIEFIKDYSRSRCVVLLDPDTGLQPANPNLEHVFEAEARGIFEALKSNDVFVFHQHKTNRNGKAWIDPPKKTAWESPGCN